MDRFYSLCLQGDINVAMKYLASISPRTQEIDEIERLYVRRFYSENVTEVLPTDDTWVRRVISAYYTYFRAVLTKAESVEEAESQLNKSLGDCLVREIPNHIVEKEIELRKVFSEKGYYFLGGVTKPYRGPYIWRNMETRDFYVETPLANQKLTVNMMCDFILESWIGYATFGKRSAGGWAKGDGLYCNSRLFKDLDGADFQISFLKHEAQHYYDYKHFPWLTSRELEYRAKLVELIYMEDHSVLRKFIYEAKSDLDYPHPFASYRLIRDLSSLLLSREFVRDIDLWLEMDYNKIAAAALNLLEKDTRELQIFAEHKGEHRS